MNTPFSLYTSQFIYRIRHWLFFGSLIITALVYYFSQFMSKSYTSSTSLYAGVSSAISLNEDQSNINFTMVNSTYDNLINLAKSKGTLEKVALRLLAQSYVKGESNEDTEEIKAQNYQKLISETPEEIKRLINRKSEKKTLEKIQAIYKRNRTNFIYRMVNGDNPYFSYNGMSSMTVTRLNSSDFIKIEYTTTDPGIAESTVRFVSEELRKSYDELRFSSARSVVAYFERELKNIKAQLRQEEDVMTQYSIANGVVNYYEQSKALAVQATDFNSRYQQVLEEYQSANAAFTKIESTMDIRNKLLNTNKDFLSGLDQIATSTEYTVTKEFFNSQDNLNKDPNFIAEQQKISDAENELSKLANNIDVYNYNQKGVKLEQMVTEWLNYLITMTKAKAQLNTMDKWKVALAQQYRIFSPIGTMLGRYERTIGTTEEQLKLILHGLHLAKLKEKNIELSTASLKIITEPNYPFSGNNKRWVFIMAAFFGSLLFILGAFLIIELLDRTLRDESRATRLTKTPVLGALTGFNDMKFRGYTKACNRIAIGYAANRLNSYLKQGEVCIINLLSFEQGEGKSFIAKFLAEHWENIGFDVTVLQSGKDFNPNTKEYVLAENLNEIWKTPNPEKPNIILIEHPKLYTNIPPKFLLKKAKINLLICNAQRLWKRSDEILLNQLKDEIGSESPMYIYLNNADRYAVESFTGDLPPQLPIHSVIKQIFSLGLTAQSSSIQ